MKYRYLIFDVDDTLLDFYAAYSQAQRAVAARLGVAFSAEYAETDEALGWKYWAEFGLDNTGDPDVQRHYHDYYFKYLNHHFTALAQAFGSQAQAEDLLEAYFSALASCRKPMEEATLPVYRKLSQTYGMMIATNGVGRVQRARLRDFLPASVGVYISEEVGWIKPAKAFYQRLLEDGNCRPQDCLMIGDSLSNDMSGAAALGMSTCWYNRKKRPVPSQPKVDWMIETIEELPGLLRGGASG